MCRRSCARAGVHKAFAPRSFWLTPLVMAILPGWFLHSRTGFETALATSYYALFVMAYLLYRQGRPRWILAALALGAAAAYSYANAQLLMVGTGLLLLLVDLPFHLEQLRRHRREMLIAVALVPILLAPYVRFRLLHPDATANQLKGLQSYWLADQPIATTCRASTPVRPPCRPWSVISGSPPSESSNRPYDNTRPSPENEG